MFREDFSLTKRHLGWLLLVAGGLAVVGLLSLDLVAGLLSRTGSEWVSPDRQMGIGPAQALALGISALTAVVGLSLIPLGRATPVIRIAKAHAVELPRPWARAGQVLMALALLAMIGYFLIYLVYAVNLILFPFDYDQGEGFELVDTILFSQFQWPYRDTETYPFYSSNYPPLFHIIAAPFVWLFGPGYWYGRLLSLAGTLITAAAISYAVYCAEPHRPVAAISGLAYLASNYIYHVGPLFRQHLFMVMFETLAVVVLAHVHEIEAQKRRRWVMATGIAFLLAAGYTKQLAIATCVAVFIFLFIYNPRRSLVWGLILAAIAGALFLLIDLSTAGQWRLNIITANVNPFVPGQFEGLFRQWFGLHGVLIVLAGLMILYELYFDQISVYSIWFIAATANTLLAGKWGAGDSYFATVIAATTILSGIFAARTVRGTWRFPENYLTRPLVSLRSWLKARQILALGVAGVIVPALFLVYAVAVFHMPTSGPIFGPISRLVGLVPNTRFALYDSAGYTSGYAVLGQIPTEEDIENGWRLAEIVAEGDAPAISEDAAFSIQAGKPVIANPTQLLNLYLNGLYDSTNLVAMIEDQAFSVLVLRALFYPDPVLYAMGQAYHAEESIPMNGFDYHIFRPDPTWPARRALRDDINTLGNNRHVQHVIQVPQAEAEAWVTALFIQAGWEQAGAWANGEAVFQRETEQAAVTIQPESEDTLCVRLTHESE